MFRYIRWRIAIPFIVLILVSMAGISIYLLNFVKQSYLDNLENRLASEARLIGQMVKDQMTSSPDSASLDTQAREWRNLLDTRVTLIDAGGVVLGESDEDPAKMENHLNRPEIQQAITLGVGSSTRFSHTVGIDMLYVAVPLQADGKTIGFARLALPLQRVHADIAHLQRTLLGSTLLAALAAMLLATWIAGRTTAPLSQLTRAAAQIAGGDLEGQIVPTSQDEVGQLTRAFNTMAQQLRAQIGALESERSRLSTVVQEMTDGLMIIDARGAIRLINPAAAEMFSVSEEEVLGRSLVEVIRNFQIVELWRLCQQTGMLQSATMDIGARSLYLQGVATPLGGARTGESLLLFQNLTRLRQLETVRRDFISNISHELRTPLASLKALTETLQDSALEDPPAAQRFLQRMETEVDALSLMVSELLELSRIESGKAPLQLQAEQPCELVAAAASRLELQAERAGLSLEIDCSPNLPPVLADAHRLEQVIVNLLHNAIKFTSPPGNVILRAYPGERQVVFSVTDTGMGIPASDLPRIFERFYKADRARASHGTGLGLAIARHLVEAHGGRIWVESVEGTGSTFFFSIPTA